MSGRLVNYFAGKFDLALTFRNVGECFSRSAGRFDCAATEVLTKSLSIGETVIPVYGPAISAAGDLSGANEAVMGVVVSPIDAAGRGLDRAADWLGTILFQPMCGVTDGYAFSSCPNRR